MKKLLLFMLGLSIIFLNPLIIEILWSWFVVPMTHYEISYIQAFGFNMIYNLFGDRIKLLAIYEFQIKSLTTDEKMDMRIVEMLAILFNYPFILGFGYILKGFM